MNPFEMVVTIVLIVTIGRFLSARYGHGTALSRRDARRVARGELVLPEAGSVSAVEAERMKTEITRLHERLAVLERIATDPAKRLSDEIDNLKNS